MVKNELLKILLQIERIGVDFAETSVRGYIFFVTEGLKQKIQIFTKKDFAFYKYICKMYTLADI